MVRLIRRRRPVATGRKRKFIWSRFNEDLTPTALTNAVDLLTDFRTVMGTTANLPGCTITRIRMGVQVDFQVSPAPLGRNTGILIGIYVSDLGQLAAQVANPILEPNVDWMWHQWVPISIHENLQSGTAATGRLVGFMVDVKSQRKLDEVQQTLYFSYAVTGGITAEVFLLGSVGLKLP